MLKSICKLFPWLRQVFTDGGRAVEGLGGSLRQRGTWMLQIVRHCDHDKGFETSATTATAWFYADNVKLLVRRIART